MLPIEKQSIKMQQIMLSVSETKIMRNLEIIRFSTHRAKKIFEVLPTQAFRS